MPNHITNIVTIKGEEKAIAKVMKLIKGDDEAQFIDFNRIAPIPKELQGTRSPMKTISKEEYIEQERKIKAGETDEYFGISRCLTAEQRKEYMETFGADNWYDWQIANWGTKWNAYSQSLVNDNTIQFDTAWGTPLAIMENMSKKFPDVTIEVRYADEDFGYNVGKYTLSKGIMTESEQPEGGSMEAMKMAMEITGESDYHTHDIFEDYDDDEFDGWLRKHADLNHAISGKVSNIMSKEVLQYLLDLAVEAEQFERAKEIQDIMTPKLA
jgi:hypothetical protein